MGKDWPFPHVCASFEIFHLLLISSIKCWCFRCHLGGSKSCKAIHHLIRSYPDPSIAIVFCTSGFSIPGLGQTENFPCSLLLSTICLPVFLYAVHVFSYFNPWASIGEGFRLTIVARYYRAETNFQDLPVYFAFLFSDDPACSCMCHKWQDNRHHSLLGGHISIRPFIWTKQYNWKQLRSESMG